MILTNMLTGGGVERVTSDLVNYLSQLQYSVTVIALNDSGEVTEYPENIKTYSCVRSRNLKNKSFKALIFRIKQLLLCLRLLFIKTDTVIAMHGGMATFLALKIRAKRRIVWIHNDYYHFRDLRRHFKTNEAERAFLSRFDKTICVSEYVKQSVIDTIGDTGNMTVCHNPINETEIRKAANAFTVPRTHSTEFVTVGRLSQEKRVIEVIRAFKKIPEKYDAKLKIIGDGGLMQDAKTEAKDCRSAVEFCGWLNNPYPHIKAADWLINASETESFGLTIFEALICGTPVLVSDLPVLKEFEINSKIVIIGGVKTGIEDAMKYVLQHPELGEQIKKELAVCKDSFFDRMSKIEALL